MMLHFFKTILLLFICTLAMAEGEIIVFVSDNGSEVDKEFQTNTLPKIKQFAKENAVSFELHKASEGLPPGITTLPAIVYQNHLGRSVYVGRYNQMDKVINFVRTAKRIPQTKDEHKKELVQRGWTLEDGKAHTELKVKLTDLAGTPPKRFDPVSFAMSSEIDIVAAMKSFAEVQEYEVAPTDRKFYANFYPYRSQEGLFYVTTELYSQFHCHEPIYTTLDNPFTGSWKDKDEVLKQAALDMEKQIKFHRKNPDNGDGFDVAHDSIPQKSWESLGCALPAAPQGMEQFSIPLEIPKRWKVKGPVSPLDPMVAFTFPPPVDNYSGEVKKLDGLLNFSEKGNLTTAKGEFAVNLHSLTMGEPDLDESVKAEDMLNVNNYPGATFAFDQLQPVEASEMVYGKMLTAQAKGKFTFLGKTIDKTVNTQITPIVDEAGNPLLQISASFSINILEPFGIEGPDGPEPQKNTVKYMLNFLMEEEK